MTAPLLKNRVGVSTTTTGTGTVTLGSALTAAANILPGKWLAFGSGGAGLADGSVVRYLIIAASGDVEWGNGTLGGSGTTLTRTLIGSTTGSLLSLSGTSQVFIGAIGEDIVPYEGGVELNANGKIKAALDSAATNTVTQLARLTSTSTGTPANGIGVGIEFEVETSAGNNEVGVRLEAVTTDVTATSEDFDFNIYAMAAGATPTLVANFNAGALTLPTGRLWLSGLNAPQLNFNPSTGATKSAQFYQLGDFWAVASAGVGEWLSVDLNNGTLAAKGTTASSSPTTGALTVAGGAGVAGDIYGGGNLTLNKTVAGDLSFKVINPDTTAGSDAVFWLESGSAARFIVTSRHSDATTYFLANIGQIIIQTSGASPLIFGTNNISAGAIDISQNWGIGTQAPDRRLHPEQDDATNNAVSYLERLTHTTSGTPAVGIGVGLEFEAETAASVNKVGATIEAAAYNVTTSSESFALNAKQMAANALQEALGLSFLCKSLTANVAYTNNTSAQNWFATAGGVLLEGSTTYEFEGQLLQTPGTTGHTVGLSFAGTATLTSIAYVAFFAPSLVNATITTSNFTQVTTAANTVVTPSITTAGTLIHVRGLVRVNAAGTFIPQFTFGTAPGAGNNLANTFFKLRKIGSNTNVNQGNWA